MNLTSLRHSVGAVCMFIEQCATQMGDALCDESHPDGCRRTSPLEDGLSLKISPPVYAQTLIHSSKIVAVYRLIKQAVVLTFKIPVV